MTTLPYRSTDLPFPGRRFQLWRYTVSHGQLLLVSTKDEAHPTRCEILFKDVVRVDLPTSMDDLEVEVVNARDVPGLVLQLGAYELGYRKVYRVRGRGFVGYVAAGVAVCREDEGEYHAPSSLLDGPWL